MFFLVFSVLISAAPDFAQEKEVLTNNTVIKMVKANLSEDQDLGIL